MKKVICFLLIFKCMAIFGQSAAVFCNCNDAIPLTLADTLNEKLAEGHCNSQLKFSLNNKALGIHREHKPVWYKVTTKNCGYLFLGIKSNLAKDNVDFIVFQYKDSSACDKIKAGSLKPLRFNYSDSDTNSYILTGLRNTSKSYFTKAGSRNKFSANIWVRENETYLIMIDQTADIPQEFYLNLKIAPKIYFDIPIVDKSKRKVESTVFFYDNKYKWERTYYSTYTVKGFMKENMKDLYHIVVKSKGYMPFILKANRLICEEMDTIILSKIVNDSLYYLSELVFDKNNNLDMVRSASAFKDYYEFFNENKFYKYTVILNMGNDAIKKQAKSFYDNMAIKLLDKKRIQYIEINATNENKCIAVKINELKK